MAIWKKAFTLEQLNEMGKNCAVGHLGIEISAYGENWIEAKMPVDHRTTQPFGLLHGGVSVSQNTHVWQIDIRDEQDKLCCVSRLTLYIKHL